VLIAMSLMNHCLVHQGHRRPPYLMDS